MGIMLVEVKRDNGRSESGRAEGSAAVGEIPQGAGPNAVGQSQAGAGLTAVRETIVRDGRLRNFGETGHGEVAVPVKVGPERDQLDQLGRAGEMGVYSTGGGTEPGISRQHRPRGDHQGRVYESDITDYLETESRDRSLDMPCTPAMVEVVATGKVEATATEPADVGEGTDEAVKAPTRSVMARPWVPVAMAGAPKPLKECSS